MSLLIPKISLLIAGGGGLGYGISVAVAKNPFKPEGTHVVVKLGEYTNTHELVVAGEEIFTKAGKGMQWQDFSSFSIAGHKLSGDEQITKQGQKYCLSSTDNYYKGCGDALTSQSQDVGKLKDLLYKFNFEGVTYFPEGTGSELNYQMSINKNGSNGCSLQTLEHCARTEVKNFDVIRGQLI